MEEKSLYQQMKEIWNSLPDGGEITSFELKKKTGGDMKNISAFLSSVKKKGAALKVGGTRPAIYKKLGPFRVSRRRREKKSFEETEFSALEIGEGIMAFVKELQSRASNQEETIAALKRKLGDLAAENKKLCDELERAKKRVEIINRKANGEMMRFSIGSKTQ